MNIARRHSRAPRQLIALLFLCLLLLTLTACRTTGGQSTGPSDAEISAAHAHRAQEIFLMANEALDQEQWETAIRRYEEVTNLDPSRWDAHMNRGIAYRSLQDFRQATEAFVNALEAGGTDQPLLYFNLGNLYQERGLYDYAIDAYRSGMAVAGELDYESLLNIAACYAFLHAHEPARQTIERAIELRPDDPRGQLTLGVITHGEERPEEALRIFDELLAMHPDLAPGHFNRGFVLMRIGQGDQAIAAFRKYLELAPDGPYVRQATSNISNLERRKLQELQNR